MPPTGFEPTIPASERPQNHALDRTATRIGWNTWYVDLYTNLLVTEITAALPIAFFCMALYVFFDVEAGDLQLMLLVSI